MAPVGAASFAVDACASSVAEVVASAVESGLLGMGGDALLDACRIRRGEVDEGVKQLGHLLDETEADLQMSEDQLTAEALVDASVVGNARRAIEAYSGRLRWSFAMEAGLRRGAYNLVMLRSGSSEDDEYAALFLGLAECRARSQAVGARLRNVRALLAMPWVPLDVSEGRRADAAQEEFGCKAALLCPQGHRLRELQGQHATRCGDCYVNFWDAMSLPPLGCEVCGYGRCRQCAYAATMSSDFDTPSSVDSTRSWEETMVTGLKTLVDVFGVSEEHPHAEILRIPNPAKVPAYFV